MSHEPLSVVVLTKDEARNLPDCLDALLAQLAPDDEILVVDAASLDATTEVARAYAARDARVRLEARREPLTFGAARNLGARLARHDVVAFVSADAAPMPGWRTAMARALVHADVVYGRQRHAPPFESAATVSRGLRYRHYEVGGDGLPERFASNVNAAYRRLVFERLAFDERAAGAEDVAFAREARLLGFRIRYAADAVVAHKDVADLRGELRKHVREGAAHAQMRAVLGEPVGHLAWAFAVGGLGLLAVFFRDPLLLAGTILVFFAPTLRRVASPLAGRYRPDRLLAGAAVSPLFDFAFVLSYLRRRVIP